MPLGSEPKLKVLCVAKWDALRGRGPNGKVERARFVELYRRPEGERDRGLGLPGSGMTVCPKFFASSTACLLNSPAPAGILMATRCGGVLGAGMASPCRLCRVPMATPLL
jgi:hypothetical protein